MEFNPQKFFINSSQFWLTVVYQFTRLIQRLLSNPQIAELWRFIFLGAIVEVGRIVSQKVFEAVSGREFIIVAIAMICQ
jgi:hypothetical protein